MWINNWWQIYICEDMRREPQCAEYEEILEEEELGITEEEAVKQFNEKHTDLPADITEALRYIWRKSRDGEMTDEEMATGFFLCGQINKHDNTEGADRVFWILENLYCINYELQNSTSK